MILGKKASYSFEESHDDISQILDKMEGYILYQSRRELDQILSQPRFHEHRAAYLASFKGGEDREKGILTQMKEGAFDKVDTEYQRRKVEFI